MSGTWRGSIGRVFGVMGLSLTISASGLVASGQIATAAGANLPGRPAHASNLEDRVKLLTTELNLDATQQEALRRILLEQRDRIQKVWNDAGSPPAVQVAATRGISERTGDQIRALLTEAQRKQYNQARKPREAKDKADSRGVEEWMKAASRKP